MYIFLDLVVIAVIISGIVTGIKRGFTCMCFDVFGYVIFLGISAFFAYALLLVMYNFGAIDSLAIVFFRYIGSTNAFFRLIGTTSEAISFTVATIIAFILSFIVSYILVMFVFKFIAKSLEHLRDDKLVLVIDNTFGLLLNLSLSFLLIFVVFEICKSVEAKGALKNVNEMIRACPISGFLYRHNPFSGMFDEIVFFSGLKYTSL